MVIGDTVVRHGDVEAMNWLRRSTCSTRLWQYPEGMFLFVERLRRFGRFNPYGRQQSVIISLAWNTHTERSRSWTLDRKDYGDV